MSPASRSTARTLRTSISMALRVAEGAELARGHGPLQPKRESVESLLCLGPADRLRHSPPNDGVRRDAFCVGELFLA